MASYWSFDPRHQIRQTIATSKDYNYDDTDEYIITVSHQHRDYEIPLLLPDETRGNKPYTMPYIEMILVTSPSHIHNITGDIREKETYIDMNIWYTNMDHISACSFGKDIADKLVDLVMTYRHSVSSVFWMEVLNDGRELLEESDGKQSYFHRIIEIYCNHWG